jgi:hypothetical protein
MILSTVTGVDISKVQPTTTSQLAASTPNPSSPSPSPLPPSPPLPLTPTDTTNPTNGKLNFTRNDLD